VANAASVRVSGRVRYVGNLTANEVIVGYDVPRQAATHLNRAGIDHVLPTLTVLVDWKTGSSPAVQIETQQLRVSRPHY